MSDFPNSAGGGAGSVRYINPDSLNKNPAFTNVIVVEGNVRTVHIGGQDAINASGEIVGKGDIVAQTEQILANVRAALEAGGARPEHIISGTSTWSRGNRCRPASERFRTLGPRRPTRQPSRGVCLGSCASGLLGGDGRRSCCAPVGCEPHFVEIW